jgi:hypothetical protein
LCISTRYQYCNDGLGECTAFHKCSNATVFNDGSDHINVRFNIELETDACHYLEMCCDPEDVLREANFAVLGTDYFGNIESTDPNRLDNENHNNTNSLENMESFDLTNSEQVSYQSIR